MTEKTMKDCYHYQESGLRSVWLKNGYTIKRDPEYGELVSIHDVDGLHQAIGRALANKPRLTGTEVRFLRKEMGLSQRGLGDLLGVGDQAVALWEKNGRVPKTADRMLRLVYLEHVDGNTPIIATIRRINDLDERSSDRIIAEDAKDGWHAQAA
jgi:DNA-binding transcriptional regulator YiaG